MIEQGEKLLFEISTPGACGVDLPESDVPQVELDPSLASFVETGLPEIGQLELDVGEFELCLRIDPDDDRGLAVVEIVRFRRHFLGRLLTPHKPGDGHGLAAGEERRGQNQQERWPQELRIADCGMRIHC